MADLRKVAMSVALIQYDPVTVGSKVRRRSEIDVAADAVWAMFDAGLLKPEPDMIRQAAHAAGIQLKDLREAARRFENGRPFAPRDIAVMEVLEVEQQAQIKRIESARAASSASGSKRRKKKEPVPGFRICRRCKELLPLDRFGVRVRHERKATTFNYQCRECERAYQRERYLSVKKVAAAKAILSFIAAEGDDCVGDACPMCAAPFLVGDELVN